MATTSRKTSGGRNAKPDALKTDWSQLKTLYRELQTVEPVPAGWATLADVAKDAKCKRAHAGMMLRKLFDAGKIERRKWRLPYPNGQVRVGWIYKLNPK